MDIEIREEPLSHLAEYARIPMAFQVDRIFEVTGDSAGPVLTERKLSMSYVKDYDALRGNSPTDWPRQFDLANWGLLLARVDGSSVGGAVIAFDTKGVDMLEGRSDLAVLWDLRIAPAMRRRGVASAIFSAVEHWATARGCRQLKIETQNINVPACRFYASRGCQLIGICRFAYPNLPEEIQLLWYKDL